MDEPPKSTTAKRRKPNKKTASTVPKIRVDGAHVPSRPALPRISADHSPKRHSLPKIQRPLSSGNHAIGFGLFIFLIGQSVLAWAFIAGHFAAWSVANLVSVIGITMSLIAVSGTIGRLNNRVEQLGKIVAASTPPSPKKGSRTPRREKV